ncbi:hypothetical protein [Mesorhizobium loti]|uniref:hypothetical protein n=1 Tax=Rhizobium loti TaxID=381 RepID=UPI001268C1CE|nr:hypothetical protein [Mesorhizobium loti]
MPFTSAILHMRQSPKQAGIRRILTTWGLETLPLSFSTSRLTPSADYSLRPCLRISKPTPRPPLFGKFAIVVHRIQKVTPISMAQQNRTRAGKRNKNEENRNAPSDDQGIDHPTDRECKDD